MCRVCAVLFLSSVLILGCSSGLSEEEAIAKRGYDYEARAKPLSEIITEVNEHFNSELSISEDLRDLRIIVGFKDARLDEFKTALATAVRGEWLNERLVPLPELIPVNDDHLEFLKGKLELASNNWIDKGALHRPSIRDWKKRIALELKVNLVYGTPREDGKQAVEILKKEAGIVPDPPQIHFARRFKTLTEVDELMPSAPLEPKAKIFVYGDSQEVNEAFKALALQMSDLRSASKEYAKDHGKNFSRWPYIWTVFPGQIKAEDFSVILRYVPVNAEYWSGLLQTKFYYRGKEFEAVRFKHPDRMRGTVSGGYGESDIPMDWDVEPIDEREIPEFDKVAAKVSGWDWDGQDSAKFDKYFRDPDTYDPHSFAPSGFLLSTCSRRNKNFVALVHDWMYRGQGSGKPEYWHEGSHIAGVLSNCDAVMVGDWIVVRPSEGVPREAWQNDRNEMKALAGSIEEINSLSAKAAARMFTSSPYSRDSHVFREWLQTFDGVFHYEFRRMPETGLGLLDSLAPNQSRILNNGGRVAVTDLSGDARYWLGRELGSRINECELSLSTETILAVRSGAEASRGSSSSLYVEGRPGVRPISYPKEFGAITGEAKSTVFKLWLNDRPIWETEILECQIPINAKRTPYYRLSDEYKEMLDGVYEALVARSEYASRWAPSSIVDRYSGD